MRPHPLTGPVQAGGPPQEAAKPHEEPSALPAHASPGLRGPLSERPAGGAAPPAEALGELPSKSPGPWPHPTEACRYPGGSFGLGGLPPTGGCFCPLPHLAFHPPTCWTLADLLGTTVAPETPSAETHSPSPPSDPSPRLSDLLSGFLFYLLYLSVCLCICCLLHRAGQKQGDRCESAKHGTYSCAGLRWLLFPTGTTASLRLPTCRRSDDNGRGHSKAFGKRINATRTLSPEDGTPAGVLASPSGTHCSHRGATAVSLRVPRLS